jgi:aminoglycoside phosphotransferase family enzyme/predicted kinase
MPDAAPPPAEPFAAIAETHTGVVTFVGTRAYKVKKPVAFPFVDLRDIEARRQACELEVALNRRLAPDVYIGVGGLVEPDRDGAEPVVVMRRLPAARRLTRLVLAGVPVEDHLRRIAHQVAALHAAARPSAVAAEVADVASTRSRWSANATELEGLTGRSDLRARSTGVLAAAERYLDGRAGLFARRIAEGWAREGHGDLLADDIFCLDDGPRILDCLEFDERLRVGDVLADVAFLAMDLERLGRPDLGWSLLEHHAELLGDHWPASLAHHHIAYRAQVRAKVACARARQGIADAEDLAGRLLDIAARHLDAGRVQLILVGGTPGTGKSTVATALGGELGAFVVRSDEVRKQLVGLPAGAHAPAAAWAGIYDPSTTAATYASLLDRAAQLLELGHDVVLDATWPTASLRREAEALAATSSADLTSLRCVAPDALAAERIADRQRRGTDPSDADPTVATLLAGQFEPWPGATEIDTDCSLRTSVEQARRATRVERT